MKKYIHIHEPCCSEHDDGDNINYYETLEGAKEYALRGDIIALLVEEI